MSDSLCILLIDDDEVDRVRVRRALEASDIEAEFVEAGCGREGVRLLSERAFDCALLDHGLPDMDGFGVLQAARAAGVKTPIILLTGEGDERLAVELVRAGANDYLSKSRLSRDLLAHSVRHAVRLHRAQAEALLARGLTAESEQRFRTMADSAPVLLWVADETGKTIYFNQGWLDFTGRAAAAELGEGWIEGVHPEDRDRLAALYGAARAARQKFETEFRLRRHDGQYRWVMNSGAPRFLPDGTYAGYVGLCIDITERRQAEQERAGLLAREQAARAAAEQAKVSAEASEQRYRFLAESIPQQVWTAWPDGRLDYISRTGLLYFGLEADELLGAEWLEVVHPEDVQSCLARWERSIATGEDYEIEFRLRRFDDAYRWHLGRAIAQRDAEGRIIRWFGTNTDIDDQKRNQESIRFLAEASVALASSLDYETTLAAVARLAVPQIGDWCAVDMQAPDWSLKRVAVEHIDAAKVALAEELHRRYPPRESDQAGVMNVLRTCQSELYTTVSDELIEAATYDADHAQIVQSLGLRSAIIVPLLSRGHALGAITLVTSASGRVYGPDDLALAEDLARRAATAVDNALLYRQAQEASRAKDEANALLDTLLEKAPVGFAFIDRALRFVRVNEKLAEINGVAAASHIGKTFHEVLPDMDALVEHNLQRVLQSGEAILNVETTARTPASAEETRNFFVSYYPVRASGGELLGVGTVVVEISELKRFEQELREAKNSAEAANAAKDQFLAVLSHELRTPLTPVLSTVQAMESEPGLTPDLRSSIEMIKRNVELEARLIDDLLDLTRIARGKLELSTQTVDAHQSLADAIDIVRDEIGGKGLTLQTELAAKRHYVRADSARLQQVFWNLIKNAVKFTPPGGKIWIRSQNIAEQPEPIDADGNGRHAVGSTSRGGIRDATCRLRVEVRDTGIGIEPQVLPRIFDAFEQGERSITRRFGGLGLGLAISKALIDMQGGRLTADSAGKGLGAVFVVELDAVEAPAPHPHESRQPAPASQQPSALRILLVDDHEDTARAMGRLLQRLGHRITIAHSVGEALDAFEREGADLLISDIGLPDGSGLELMRQIHHSDAGRRVRGIALSGFGMEEDVRKSKEAGFFFHLTKPINFQRLENVIRLATSTA